MLAVDASGDCLQTSQNFSQTVLRRRRILGQLPGFAPSIARATDETCGWEKKKWDPFGGLPRIHEGGGRLKLLDALSKYRLSQPRS